MNKDLANNLKLRVYRVRGEIFPLTHDFKRVAAGEPVIFRAGRPSFQPQ